MRHICPICEKETDVNKIKTSETFNIRGYEIIVPVEYLQCLECGEDFDDPLSLDDPVDSAYREYRKARGMAQPEEIKNYRKKYRLTQRELSSLLGWGGATLSRYENGALRDDAHETSLRLIMEPENLLKLIKERPEALPDGKREKLIEELESSLRNHSVFGAFYEDGFSSSPPGLLNGFKRLDASKIFNIILYFCLNGVLKTKLNKLLFYVDFKHYKDYSASITGSRYVKLPFGPVPENYDHYFASLHHEKKAIRVEEELYYQYIGEKFISEAAPDLSVLSETELETLDYVNSRFKEFNATDISDFSHKEKGYIETAVREFISYSHSDSLLI